MVVLINARKYSNAFNFWCYGIRQPEESSDRSEPRHLRPGSKNFSFRRPSVQFKVSASSTLSSDRSLTDACDTSLSDSSVQRYMIVLKWDDEDSMTKRLSARVT